MYIRFFKRLCDFCISLICSIIFLPIFIILIIVVKLDSKGPVFFRQERVGKDKKLFHILKFRTMKVDTPKEIPTCMLENPEQYITRVGKFLRKTSLDELPQIWNILAGQMSLIGPRPVLPREKELIAERDLYGANDIRPGLTGWAQINGRDEVSWKEKARLDGEYVQKMSFSFDVKCFFKTIVAVLKREGMVEGTAGQSKNKEEPHQTDER